MSVVGAQERAPGCFGAASVYSMDSQVCQGCCAFQECGPQALKTLESIKALVNVNDLLIKHKAAMKRAADARIRPAASQPVDVSPIPVAQPKAITGPVERKTASERVSYSLSVEEEVTIAKLANSRKTQEQARALCRADMIRAMREGLPKGINPFAKGGPKFMRVACDMVLDGGFTKASLKERIVKELGWKEATAASHVSMAWAILFAFKIVVMVGDRDGFYLNPALSPDNLGVEQV